MTAPAKVNVQILRMVDSHRPPGWVEFVLKDANGREWTFVEKEPVVSVEPLEVDAKFPLPGILHCQIVEKWIDEEEVRRCIIDTDLPWGVASEEGETRFEVFQREVVEREV
jgi:hypothetical protein